MTSHANKPLVVEARDVLVRAGGRTILDLSSLTLPSGELLVLLGPNGAGKSTLVNCCLGFIRPVRGLIRVLGSEAPRLGAVALRRLRGRIGYVPQHLTTAGEAPLTVREVVAIGRTGQVGWPRRLGREDRRIIDHWIDHIGLGHLAGRAYNELSGGEQRRCLIARAMAQQPELLILDEPTANLDLPTREQIVRLTESLIRETGVTIMLICHELEVVPSVCSHVAVLSCGRLAARGQPTEVLTDEVLSGVYGQPMSVVARNGRWATVPLPPAEVV